MVDIGKINTLRVRQVDLRGAWLGEGNNLVLLPRREAPPEVQEGDRLTVFIYHSSDATLAATTRIPKAQVGEFARLKVNQTSKHGAFLDWGMEKDLLVPYSEQPERMREGRSYLVKVCLDDRQRPIGTALIDLCFAVDSVDVKAGQPVQLMVWRFTELGAAVIINHRYEGLLYRDEMGDNLRPGDRLSGYVRKVRTDGKIDVTLRPAGIAGIREGKDSLLTLLQEREFLPVHDRSTPETIQRETGMSKKLFKKALGGLYKAGLVELVEDGVRLKQGKG
ncbi:MAG: hypothetical protein K0A93_05760 [Desulfuromonadaceae bacterium]|nr:hypothetical protein [Desulfuromonadaceae bacterium]